MNFTNQIFTGLIALVLASCGGGNTSTTGKDSFLIYRPLRMTWEKNFSVLEARRWRRIKDSLLKAKPFHNLF